ncbi:hypothetical protein R5R35_008160 [Gryllus longicercus]|uniref:Uncharacterized protein n=1 Tax=Gryllus longicercus TaxID=2509291 RepID=A0AAN9Z9S4_9ORTH
MLARRFLLASAALLLLAVTARTSPVPAADAAPATDDETVNYRIPTNVVPENYRLVIRPEYRSNHLIDVKKFDGELVITATVTDSTANKIVIHKANTITDLQILCILKLNDDVEDNKDQNVVSPINSFCSEKDGTLVTRPSQTEDEVTETLTINLDEASTLATNQKIRIVLVYEAVFREGGLTGFYTSTYLDDSERE